MLVVVLPSPGVRLYHTVTSLLGGGAIVYGGRSSPLSPTTGLLKVTLDPHGSSDSENRDISKLSIKQMVCTGDSPQPRWRHTATLLSHKGESFLF